MATERKPGWWYPYIFVGAFMVVVGVNVALAWFAATTFTGLETVNAYEKGLAYNSNLALAKAQTELGWRVDLDVAAATTGQRAVEVSYGGREGRTGVGLEVHGAGDRRVAVAVTYRDRDGRPVEGMTVKARLLRPTATGHDHDIALDAAEPGRYGATLTLPLEGVWDMDVAATGPGGQSYQFSRRIVLK